MTVVLDIAPQRFADPSPAVDRPLIDAIERLEWPVPLPVMTHP